MRNIASKIALSLTIFTSFGAICSAEPAKLKFTFFTSDTEKTWTTTIKPFIDAINADGKDVVSIEAYPNGALGRSLAQQLQLIQDGVADITFTVLGLMPGRFPDNTVLELPGLFNDIQDSTRTFHALAQAGKLRGYDDYFIVGALGAAPSVIHTREPITSYKDLRGKKVRGTNATEANTLRALGAASILLPVNEAAEAIARRTIDGTTMQLSAAVDFGILRVTNNHYFGRIGIAPLAVLMNRKKFESLSPEAQAIIKKYSGEWFIERYSSEMGRENERVIRELRQDSSRKLVTPDGGELTELQAVYKTVSDEWIAKETRNKELYEALQIEISKARAAR